MPQIRPTSPGRVYDTSSKTATTGTFGASYRRYGRITIGYAAVAPTSLGRVRAIYNYASRHRTRYAPRKGAFNSLYLL